ncbi:hypothetical protein HCUR_00037 [Holospora curviuscula]|uniref:Uncharacterized protein n=1 Tax=Holospora curviuscula TaxID=1082868 RepID=A0A2S5RI42_9PROT|nr:hypothetical protein HCUR_00037 [Holospora curviuscula]
MLKYVPSDDTDQDLVFMEDYSSEPLCNGITDADYFGEDYIPVLLGCIHELVPRAMSAVKWFFYGMLYDNFNNFFEDQPLIKNLYLVQKDSFKQILDFVIQETQEELEDHQKASKEKAIDGAKKVLDRIEIIKTEFLKLHGHDG